MKTSSQYAVKTDFALEVFASPSMPLSLDRSALTMHVRSCREEVLMKKASIYRVRFVEKNQGNPIEALVRHVEPSTLPGLVCLSEFVFKDSTKMIILPEEDAASKRFRQTLSMHIPYHNIMFVEELMEEPTDVRHLPFLKEVAEEKPSP